METRVVLAAFRNQPSAISLILITDCFFIFALSFCLLIFEFCFAGMSNPPYGGVEPPFLKGDLEGFLYEVKM